MSSALTGNQIKDSYQALLKIGTNGSLDPTIAIAISDGLGNDTPLQLAADKLLTNYLGNNIGLNLDFANNIYTFGASANGMTVIDGVSQLLALYSNSYPFVDLDGKNNISHFGGQGAYLRSDGNNNYLSIGDYGGQYNNVFLEVDDFNQIIQTKKGNPLGLKLDFANSIYYLGDFDNTNQNTYINVDDYNKVCQLYTNSGTVVFDYAQIQFNGATQVGNTGDSNECLNIIVNGTPYVIKLYNP